MNPSSSPTAQPKPKLWKGVLSAALLAVVVFAILSAAGDVRSLGDSLASFEPSALGVALGLVLGNYVLRYLRWQFYLRHLGVYVEARLSATVFTAGFVMSVTPGKMGEVFKSFLLNEYRGISVTRTASVVVAERLLDLVALVVLVTAASTVFPHGRVIAGAGGTLVALIVLGCTVRPLGEWVLDQLERIKLAARIVPKLRDAYGALNELTQLRPFLMGAGYAVAGWALECLASYHLLNGFPTVDVSFKGATFGYSAGTLAGALAMLPGGLGAAEASMSGLFRLASPGMTLATAAAATILIRLCTLWFGVGLGGLALLVLRGLFHKRDAPLRDP